MAALIKNRVISCTMGYLDIDLNIINLFDNQCINSLIIKSEIVMGIENIALLVRTINLITGAGLIVIGILSIIDIKEWFTFKIFLLPCPFFVAFFGLAIIAAELKIKIILKKLGFLKSLIGRGLFNIFLSSLAFWFLQGSQVLAWISAIVLFITGIIYVAFHFGYGKQLKEKQQNQSKKDEEKPDNPVRQNLI